MAFCHGDIDAMLHIGVHPDPSLQQLFRLCNAKIIDMNDDDIAKFVLQDPAFFKFTLVSGTYPDQTGDVITFGTQTLMVTSQDIDAETVYAILDALYASREKMSGAHPALALKQPDIKEKSLAGIKLHAGALQYFSGN